MAKNRITFTDDFVLRDEKVGIGTTNPTQSLHVQGSVRITGALYDSSNAAGTSGQILHSTGSDISWINASSANVGSANSIAIAADSTNASRYLTFVSTTSDNNVVYVDSDLLYNPSTNTLTAGTFSGNATTAGIATYATNAGIATYADNAGIATYATTAGIATFATTAGIATFATTAGIATFATTAGVSTNVIGGIASVTQLSVSGISTLGTVQISSGIITATSGVVTYYGDGSKLTDILASSIVGVSSFATNAGIATNLKGGLVGNIPYQSATDTTVFLANGSSGTILQSNGVGNAPTWVSAAPASAITGLTVRDEGTIVGSANSVSELNFVGAIVSATSSAGIATITFVDYVSNAGVATYASLAGIATYADNAGISTYASVAGIATFATNAGVSTYADIAGFSTFSGYSNVAGVATALQYSRTFEITGDIVASPISFDGTGNVSLAATIQPNSVGLGTDTFGDYVQSITGTANQISVSVTSGEASAPTLSIPNQFTAPQDLTVIRDVQINRNLNVNGNITIGGTSATIFSQSLNIFDPDIILGFRTDAFGNDVSTDNTANHGGVAVASTEGTPLVQLFIDGIETNPATYKKIMWFKESSFAGLGTDAWLFNYAVGIGSTQFPSGTRLAAGSVQFTENDLSVVRNINASGVVTASSFRGDGSQLTGVTGTQVVSQPFTSTPVYPILASNAGVSSVGIATTGSNALVFIPSSGNLGIGTTIATSKLDVRGDVLVSGVVTASSFRGDGSQLTGVTGTQVVSQPFTSTPVYPILASNSGVSSVGIATTGSTALVFIPSSGNLGIGTTNPTSKLHVIGDVLVSGVVTASSFVGTLTGNASSATFATTAGISTNVIGGIASVTQLNVSGVSTLGTLRISSGIVTATTGIVTYYGDGSKLTGVAAASADSYLFNTGISSSFSTTLLGIGSTIFTFPATAGKEYIVLSVNCSNVSTGNTEVNVIGAFDFNGGERSYFAYNVPIPTGTAVEIMKQPQVLNPSDRIVMRSTNFSRVGTDSIVEVYVSYQEKTSTSYFGVGLGTVGLAVTDFTAVYTSSTYPSVIQSIRLANVTDSGGYPVSVQITNGLTTTRLVDNLIVPKYASVEVLDTPKRIETNSVIQVQLDQGGTMGVQVSGSQITS
jgi:hypothetical protein